jgi:hypothetical protein
MLENRDHSRAEKPFQFGASQVKAVRDLRYREFQQRTAAYLRRAFPALMELRSDEELHAIAGVGLQRAGAWGRETEREIWEYLIPMCFFGSFFDADPQYAHMISAAGWQRAEAPATSDMEFMRKKIDAWFPVMDQDYANVQTVIHNIVTSYKNTTLRMHESDLPFELVEKAVCEWSPRRWSLIPAEGRHRWFEACRKRAQALEFTGRDALAYYFASFFFGYAFERNPIYPWAWKTIIEMNASNEVRILTFAEEARKHILNLAARNRLPADIK